MIESAKVLERMKYPKYKRCQKLSAKLDDIKVSEIRLKYCPRVYSMRKLAKEYGVSYGAIAFILADSKKLKRRYERGVLWHRLHLDKVKKNAQQRRYYRRKVKVQPETHDYHRILNGGK